MDNIIDTWKMQEENILTAWQTPVSVWALIAEQVNSITSGLNQDRLL